MKKIEIDDLKSDNEVNAEEAAAVKGGPAYMKLGDIKGDVQASRLPSEQITLGYTEVEWTY